MTTKTRDRTSKTRETRLAALIRRPIYTPTPEPPKKPDMNQGFYIIEFNSILIAYYFHRADVFVSYGGYIRLSAGNPLGWLVPDSVVAFGVDVEAILASDGYTIDEVGKPPDFVLEVASKSTGERDYTFKRLRYAAFGVIEYWRFDPTGGRFHDVALAGDILVNGVYHPIEIHEEPGGLLWGYSPTLELDLCWDESRLRLRDPITKEYLRNAQESEQRGDEEQQRANREQQRADEEQRRANRERAARIQAESELRRLRALLSDNSDE